MWRRTGVPDPAPRHGLLDHLVDDGLVSGERLGDIGTCEGVDEITAKLHCLLCEIFFNMLDDALRFTADLAVGRHATVLSVGRLQ